MGAVVYLVVKKATRYEMNKFCTVLDVYIYRLFGVKTRPNSTGALQYEVF